MGACSSVSLDSNPFAQASSIFKPDTVTNSGKARYSSVVTQDELIGADGRCAGGPVTPSAIPEAPPPDAGEPAGTVGQGLGSSTALPANDPLVPTTMGVALGMSECEVARRAGAPERVEVGTDDRGERAVTLSYLRGERAGIYRFREGRLFTIERVIVAEPEKPKKPVKSKAASKPAPKRAAEPKQAAAPAQAAAPKQNAQQQQKPAQGAPWPAPQGQAPAQSQVWPSPPPLRNGQPAG